MILIPFFVIILPNKDGNMYPNRFQDENDRYYLYSPEESIDSDEAKDDEVVNFEDNLDD